VAKQCDAGHDNPDEAQFCSTCGLALAVPTIDTSAPAPPGPSEPTPADEDTLVEADTATAVQAPETAEGEPPKSNTRRNVLIGAAVAVVLVVAIASANSGGSSKPTIKGMFTLFDTDVVGDVDSCSGTDGYDDVGPGMNVTVRNAEGDIIGSGHTRAGDLEELAVRSYEVDNDGEQPGDADLADIKDTLDGVNGLACPLMFEVEVDKSDFYEVEVGSRGKQSYSQKELEDAGWVLNLSLGS
jgi:hypothetical protein